MRPFGMVALGGLGVGLGAGVGLAYADRVYRRSVEAEIDALLARAGASPPPVLREEEITGLPDPVQRWLRGANVIGKPRPVTVRLKQVGTFRMAAGSPWIPFTAEQYYLTEQPAFIWYTRMGFAGMPLFTGRDRYVDGRGQMAIRLLSAFPLVNASGPNLDQGAALRYLNETMWFPAAVVSPHIDWEGVNATTARATFHYGGVEVAATYYFNEAGDLVNFIAERFRADIKQLATWSTPVGTYGEFAGVRMPVAGGEGVWLGPGDPFPYVRLRLTTVEYNVPARFSQHLAVPDDEEPVVLADQAAIKRVAEVAF